MNLYEHKTLTFLFSKRGLLRCLFVAFVTIVFIISPFLVQAQLAGYRYKKMITIESDSVVGTADHTNFPILINHTDTDLRTTGNGGNVTDANGYDIVFTAADGTTLLDFDLEKHIATTGDYVAWVKIPTLDYNNDTDIYIYYGNSSVTTNQSSTSAWDGDYQGIWHLNEATDATNIDATTNTNDGTPANSPTSANGKIGLALDFNTSTNNTRINIPAHASLDLTIPTAYTISAWVKPTVAYASQDGWPCAYGYGGFVVTLGVSRDQTTDGVPESWVNNSQNLNGTSVAPINDWTYLTLTSASDSSRIYFNGDWENSIVRVNPGSANQASYIAAPPANGGDFMGLIDEVRVSDIQRSADWIATEYNSQNSPSTFYSMAAEEIAESFPGNVSSNLVLWLKADAGALNGASSATDGQAVNTWEDQSGARSKDATDGQYDAPSFRNNITDNINFNPLLDFDGTNDGLDFNDDYIYSSGSGSEDGMTWFAIVQPDVAAATKIKQYVFNFGWQSNEGYGFCYGEDNLFQYSPTDHGGESGSATHSRGTQTTLSTVVIEFGNQQDCYLDGAGTATYTESLTLSALSSTEIDEQATTISTREGPFTIGHQCKSASLSNDDGRMLDGSIAELIGYNRVLDTTERSQIESYLAFKYGITLNNTGGGTAGDYLASDSTLVWDASVGDFQNGILAIGRDDAQSFYQKQSHTSGDSLKIFIDNLAVSNALNSGTITHDTSYIFIGNSGAELQGDKSEIPAGIYSRLSREWKITNTNFSDTFSLEFEWDSTGAFDIDDIRLLVDDDGDFNNATVLDTSDGLTFTLGSIIVGGISTAHIPLNSTKYITIGSAKNATPLPIELLSFEAKVLENNSVGLAWITASELGNAGFSVERSKDRMNWNEFSFVPGAGNSNQVLNYSAKDHKPFSGLSHYRLKQSDIDGNYTYSDESTVFIDEANWLRTYPNPVSELLIINGSIDEISEWEIYNLLGTKQSELINVRDNNENLLVLDLSRLASGIYLLKTKFSTTKIQKL